MIQTPGPSFSLFFNRRWYSLYGRLFAFMLIALITRIILFTIHLEQIDRPFAVVLPTIGRGCLFDLLVALAACAPHLLWLLLAPAKSGTCVLRRSLGAICNFSWYFLFLYLAVVEIVFFDEFNSRFNYVAVDYLIYPHEVFVNIWESYPVLGTILATAAVALLLHALSRARLAAGLATRASPQSRVLFASVYALCALALGNYLSIDQARVSDNRVVNEIASNGIYDFFLAAYTNELDYDTYYAPIDREEGFRRLRRLIKTPDSHYSDNDGLLGITRHISASAPEQHKNIVIILEESLGSNFSALLNPDGDGVTPRLDAIARRGLLGNNVYATGNRTVRGLEATLTGFAPIPGRSIVKRPGGRNVYSLPALLKAKGYQTRFIYGGRAYFDNMGDFARQNAFDTVVDQSDFADREITFSTIWGVCDDDLFNRSLSELDKLAAKGAPFFATILTVSNHKPYTFPAGRIAFDPEKRKRAYAVRYADHALGEFLGKAQSHDFFRNTLFVILGDHGARVYGSEQVPIESYRIPVIFYAPGFVQPGLITRLGSQLDVAPTLLGLLDMDYESQFFGRDLRKVPDEDAFAVMSHNRDVALLKGDRLAVLGMPKSVSLWRVIPPDNALERLPEDTDPELLRDARAYYQSAYYLYRHHLLHPLPQKQPEEARAYIPGDSPPPRLTIRKPQP